MNNNTIKYNKLLVSLTILFFVFNLQSCGGGNSSIGDTPSNQNPNNNNPSDNTPGETGIMGLSAGNATKFTIAQIDVAQTFSQPVKSTYQYLTPSRQAIVRVYAYAPSGTITPRVTMKVGNNSEVALTCPTTLPTYIPNSPIIEYDINSTCYGTIPANQVIGSMSIKITSDDFSKSLTPNVSSNNKINVVMVLTSLNSVTSAFTSTKRSEMFAEIKRSLPFSDINVSTRAGVWNLNNQKFNNGVTLSDNLGNSQQQWEEVVQALEELRKTENSSAIYYGLIPINKFSGGIAGIAYCNGCNNLSGQTVNSKSFSAVGLDLSSSSWGNQWLFTFLHEAGHTVSAMHAPCSATANVDPNYPYFGGTIGSAAIRSSADSISFENPLNYSKPYDVMGYCSGTRFSDYSYRRIQNYLDNNSVTAASILPLLTLNNIENPQKLFIQGSINPKNKSAKIKPIKKIVAISPDESLGIYQLKLYANDGAVYKHSFNSTPLADIMTNEEFFSLTINPPANNAKITRVEILENGQQLSVSTPLLPNKLLSYSMTEKMEDSKIVNENVNVSEVGKNININWNNSLYPWLKLTHIQKNGVRQVVTLNATGGSTTLPINIEAGGKWEVSLSDGLNSVLQTITR